MSKSFRLVGFTRFIRPGFAVALLLSWCISANAPAREHSPAVGMTFSQVSAETGRSRVFISNDGLRIENSSRDTLILSCPPKWDVILARPKDKLYSTIPLETWCKSSNLLLLVCAGSWDDDWSRRPSRYCSYSGLPGHQFEYCHGQGRLQADLLVDSHNTAQKRLKLRTVLTVIDSGLPLAERRILERFNGTPHMTGVPVEYRVFYKDGSCEKRLRADDFRKEVTGGDFALSSDYRSVPPNKLVLSEGERHDFDELFKDMDIGRPFGKPAVQP